MSSAERSTPSRSSLYDANVIRMRDELLGCDVTQGILNIAEAYLVEFARKLGVKETDIEPSFLVSELVTLYAYREVCVCKAYAMGRTFRNSSQQDEDLYSRKLTYYVNRIKEVEQSTTADDLTGNRGKDKTYRAVEIWRG